MQPTVTEREATLVPTRQTPGDRESLRSTLFLVTIPRVVSAPKIFISHTDSDEAQRRATTAIVVELRRVGIEVWVDRENPPPSGDLGHPGPTPENALFHHILEALTSSDALLYVISPRSFEREWVRFEFDPRVLYQKFALSHSSLPVERLPIYLALVEPIAETSSLWTFLIDVPCAARVLNLTGAAYTPLILPTVLMTLIRDIAPDHVFPLNPVTEWAARQEVEAKATEAPGCPEGVPATTWLRFESLFGLGPLFPNSLASLTEQDSVTVSIVSAIPQGCSRRNPMLRPEVWRVWSGDPANWSVHIWHSGPRMPCFGQRRYAFTAESMWRLTTTCPMSFGPFLRRAI